MSATQSFERLEKLSELSTSLKRLLDNLPPKPHPPSYALLIKESLRLSTLSAPPSYLPEVTPIIGFSTPCVRVEDIKMGIGGWIDEEIGGGGGGGGAAEVTAKGAKAEEPDKDEAKEVARRSIELRPEDIAMLEKEKAERQKKKEEKRRKKEEKRLMKEGKKEAEEEGGGEAEEEGGGDAKEKEAKKEAKEEGGGDAKEEPELLPPPPKKMKVERGSSIMMTLDDSDSD